MSDWAEKEGYSTRILAKEIDLDSKGCEIQLVRIKKGKYSHYHKRKTESFFIIKGVGRVIIDSQEQVIREGSHLIIKPYVRHTFVNDSKDIIEAIMMKTNNDSDDTYRDDI